jgi:hypothetical protein
VVRFWRVCFVLAFGGLLALPPVLPSQGALPKPSGPCTAAAAASMPTGSGHNHLNITQHNFGCRVALAFFDPLLDELDANPDVILGEMDIENDIMAILVAFPEAGVLFYDVSNPARPVFKSWYRHSKCEEVTIDVDCGAYVDLSEDGKVAFLSLQNISSAPEDFDPGLLLPITQPGVQVIDIRDPSNPIPTHYYAAASGVGGTHTSNSHIIPQNNPVNPKEDPSTRAPGEYLFSVANSFSVHISKVNRDPVTGVPTLTPVSDIRLDESHDTFIHNDSLTGRTYLYVAAGFFSGFYVYDVTNPATPELLAEWDLTPECGEDWYGHTAWTVIRNGRRYVTIDAELFRLGQQDPEDQAEGCGMVVGNGNRPGPLWIVDATDFSDLQPAVDNDGEEEGAVAQQIKENSRRTLAATWVNPARRPAGNIRFSPHNQQVVGNRIYLSHYHGGVYELNASAVFSGERGRAARPTELSFVVPHGRPVRPFHEGVGPDPILIPFFMEFFQARPTVWDTLFYKGCVLIPDSPGGLYSYSMGGIACGNTNIGGDDDRGDD